jgi:hypothetical protein
MERQSGRASHRRWLSSNVLKMKVNCTRKEESGVEVHVT